MKSKQEILILVDQALEVRVSIYTWSKMINDIDTLTIEEKDWAQNHTSYKAYKC